MRGTPFSAGQIGRVTTSVSNILQGGLEEVVPKDLLSALEVEGSTTLLETLLANAMKTFIERTKSARSILKRNGEAVVELPDPIWDLFTFYFHNTDVHVSEFPNQRGYFENHILPDLDKDSLRLGTVYKLPRFNFRSNVRDEKILPAVTIFPRPFAFEGRAFALLLSALLKRQARGTKGPLHNDGRSNHFYVTSRDGDLWRYYVVFGHGLGNSSAKKRWMMCRAMCGTPESPCGSGAVIGDQLFLPPLEKKQQ